MTALTNVPLDDTRRRRAMQSAPTTGLRAWLSRFTEPHILFPGLTILVLAVIWGTTLNLIKVERSRAAAAAAAAALELVNTYELRCNARSVAPDQEGTYAKCSRISVRWRT